MNTLDSILDALKDMAENKGVLDMDMMMTASAKLNIFLQEEQTKLIDMESRIAQMRKAFLEDGKTAVYAKMMVEASAEYSDARKQKAKIDRILETIKITKKHATLASDLMRSNMN